MSDAIPSSAISLKSRLLWLASTPLLIMVDQFTKIIAVRELGPLQHQPPLSYLGDMLRLQYAANRGAFGSLGAGLTPTQRFWLLTVFNAVLLAGLLIYLLTRRDVTRYQFIAFGLIFAGGIGNLIDRAQYGYVVDFLNVGIGWLRTNIFNVADMYISLGFVLLIPILFGSVKEPAATSSTSGHAVNGAA